jgi:hypothetical protein
MALVLLARDRGISAQRSRHIRAICLCEFFRLISLSKSRCSSNFDALACDMQRKRLTTSSWPQKISQPNNQIRKDGSSASHSYGPIARFDQTLPIATEPTTPSAANLVLIVYRVG